MDNELANTKKKKPLTNGFIPKLKDKKVTIRLLAGGQPITGTIDRYNPYELRIQTAKGKLVLFKHAIATIEVVDEPKSYSPDNHSAN
jgi:sRNA-binding regulator protein Hfq